MILNFLNYLILKIKNKDKNIEYLFLNNIIHKKTIKTQFNKTIETIKVNGEIHCENDFPAYVIKSKYRDECVSIWYKKGEIHRDNDLPAYKKGDNKRKWYHNGILHRENDKPAIVDGCSVFWYKNGELHRDNDQYATKTFESLGIVYTWYQNGKKHRLEQPAEIMYCHSGCFVLAESYYLEGYSKSDNKYQAIKTKIKLKGF